MDIAALQAFLAVAETGSFCTLAARPPPPPPPPPHPPHRTAPAPWAAQALPRELPGRTPRSALHGFGKGLPRGGPARDRTRHCHAPAAGRRAVASHEDLGRPAR